MTTVVVDPEDHVCGQVESLSPFLRAQRLPAWEGFLAPVENPPKWNEARGGSVSRSDSASGVMSVSISP